MLQQVNPSLPLLDRRFVQRLKAFADGGYRFDGKNALKPGTQHEAFDGYLQGIRDGHRHGYYDIPTGVGKTALFLSLIKNYLDAANGHNDSKRVLVVVPNVGLVKQAFRDFAKFMPELAPKLEADDDTGQVIDLKKLDWDSGNLGLQFGQLKHADKKPRVLITTYASLRRDKENKVYDPKEFGLVVYDEGHSITADEAGKAVGKFEDALQLAVTATPDYSEEKRVGKKLAHCYYRLPLAEAINRGDLCGVRPILIKTDFTVDAAKVEEYIKANNGKPLTDDQLQDLFNVEARNRSVIETYLAAHDPDNDERFLGQNGLIFSGGIRHADDMVAQFNKALGERRFSKIRRWLADENLEVAAAIHSGAKGAWLRPGLLIGADGNPLPDRKRQAQREWYSEDEIRHLHDQGKILLLISDKKLREGYDCPKDSIVIDMVDRLSVVDVTQRFGRGFRLDPDDSEKVCTPINLVDTNTYEIFKDRPQMLPIYAAEILEGAEFRKPMKRKLTRKFTHEIPEANQALEYGEFEIISDPEVVREHSKRDRTITKAPPAKPGWMSGNGIKEEFGGRTPTYLTSIQTLRREKLEALRAAGMEEADATREVEEKWVQWANNHGKETWFISPDGIEELIHTGKLKMDRAPKAKPGWMSGKVVETKYGGDARGHKVKFEALREEKLEALRAVGMKEEDALREVEDKWVQWASTRRGESWHISPKGLQELIQTGKVKSDRAPKAKPSWMSGSSVKNEYGGTTGTHDANIQALREEKLATMRAAGMEEADAMREVEDKWVQLASARQGGGPATWHISPEGLQELIRAGKVKTDRVPKAKPSWISGSGMRGEYGGGSETHVASIEALREEKLVALQSAGKDEAEARREVEDKWVQWAMASSSGKEAWHVSPEGLQELIQAGKVRARPGSTQESPLANGEAESAVGKTDKHEKSWTQKNSRSRGKERAGSKGDHSPG